MNSKKVKENNVGASNKESRRKVPLDDITNFVAIKLDELETEITKLYSILSPYVIERDTGEGGVEGSPLCEFGAEPYNQLVSQAYRIQQSINKIKDLVNTVEL